MFCKPKSFIKIKRGTTIAWNGIMMVDSIIIKNRLLYLNLYFAKPYPAVVHNITANKTAKNVTKILLKKYLGKSYSV